MSKVYTNEQREFMRNAFKRGAPSKDVAAAVNGRWPALHITPAKVSSIRAGMNLGPQQLLNKRQVRRPKNNSTCVVFIKMPGGELKVDVDRDTAAAVASLLVERVTK